MPLELAGRNASRLLEFRLPCPSNLHRFKVCYLVKRKNPVIQKQAAWYMYSKMRCILTAANVDVTGLVVHGELLQVHVTAENQRKSARKDQKVSFKLFISCSSAQKELLEITGLLQQLRCQAMLKV